MNNWIESWRFRIRERLARRMKVFDGDHWLTFRCDSPTETWRAKTIQTKEAGTAEWIRREVRLGDVFADIGANIGLYTLMAAKRVGQAGQVYAFEPHIGNAFSLLRNCELNGLGGTVELVTSALADSCEFSQFNYSTWLPGSSMSQFGTTLDDKGDEINPVFSELKYGVTLDKLVDTGVCRRPDLIKIDVDGNEPQILEGMQTVLTTDPRPRFLQVEIGPRNATEVSQWLDRMDYMFDHRHETAAGAAKIAAGADPESIAHNALYRPKTRHVASV